MAGFFSSLFKSTSWTNASGYIKSKFGPAGPAILNADSTTTPVANYGVVGEVQPRISIMGDGSVKTGSGTSAPTTQGKPAYTATAALQTRQRFTVAQVNTGATVLAAPGAGYAYRMVNVILIAIGGAASGADTVDIIGTRTTPVSLYSAEDAALTENTAVLIGTANTAILAAGASFTVVDANTAITIGKTGGSLATATHIDVILTYAIDVA